MPQSDARSVAACMAMPYYAVPSPREVETFSLQRSSSLFVRNITALVSPFFFCGEFGSPYLCDSIAAGRAALPSRTSVCDVVVLPGTEYMYPLKNKKTIACLLLR